MSGMAHQLCNGGPDVLKGILSIDGVAHEDTDRQLAALQQIFVQLQRGGTRVAVRDARQTDLVVGREEFPEPSPLVFSRRPALALAIPVGSPLPSRSIRPSSPFGIRYSRSMPLRRRAREFREASGPVRK